MAYENLPGIFNILTDGNLKISAVNSSPVVLVIGTAPRGPSDNLFFVNSVADAARVFGRSDGTLVRGLYEVSAGGAENIRLLRIGASPAVLSSVGTGITITTVEKDDNAGDNYSLFWDDTAKRLRIYRVADSTLIYDNNPTYPSAAIDEGEVSVSGTASGSPGNIGTLSVPITLENANGVSGAVFTAGSDGIVQSRMGMYEELFKAYKLLENEALDHVLPMNVFLDDANTQDLTTAQLTSLQSGAPWLTNTYPDAGTSYDVLGEIFAQEYQGEWYFWWDLDRDGIAEIFPTGVGSASSTSDAFGNTLENADFHEANFAYQLADFCFRQSENNQEMIGFIGVLPPNSLSMKDVAAWVGKAPELTEDTAGNSVVLTNGTGLLGNKWMAGRKGSVGSGLPGQIINGIDGLDGGGFIATDSGWPDGEQQKDRNEHLVDIGKYISVVGAQAILANPTRDTSYIATGASVYSGFVSVLVANSAPTNKLQPGVRLPFKISLAKLDLLAGKRYVMFQDKSKGIVVSDAPTAARRDSDYQRLSTIRIVKAVIDGMRSAGDPFLGEGITGGRLAALETALTQVLVRLQKAEFITAFQLAITSTPTQRIQGKADVELVLVPAFELRQLTVNISLSAQ